MAQNLFGRSCFLCFESILGIKRSGMFGNLITSFFFNNGQKYDG